MGTLLRIPLAGESAGTVFADVVVTNHRDEVRRDDGALRAGQVRRVELESVLVDTVATTLCLPRDVVEALGLPLDRPVTVTTVSGEVESAIFGDATVTVEGRSRTVECLALPAGARPLLGVMALEALGMEPDLANRQLRILPETGSDTYLYA